MLNPDQLKIQLSQSEQEILDGSGGPVLQKVMETVARYGKALNAPCLAEIMGPGHLVIPWSVPGKSLRVGTLEELVDAGSKTTHPFTLDPPPLYDFENLYLPDDIETAILEMNFWKMCLQATVCIFKNTAKLKLNS